jgi:pilus assembly protein Flp/PilA
LPCGITSYSELTDTERGAAIRKRRKSRFAVAVAVAPPVRVVFINLPYGSFKMSTFASAVKTFMADENGVTAIEYGLIAALIGVAVAGTAKVLGTDISDLFTRISGKVTAAV